jgi:DNA-directed RNA polymerase specialized sigma24 family protein
MYDLDAPSSKRVLALLEEEETRPSLVREAKRITGSWADADDLVSDALMRVLDPEDLPWESRTFLAHMKLVMRHVWGRQQRPARVKKEIADEDVTRGKKGLSREPRADDELDRRRWLAESRKLGETLLTRIEHKSPYIRPCFELSAQGIESAEEQATILKCAVADVRAARRTIHYHAERLLMEWLSAEEQRMGGLREQFRRLKRKVWS